MRYNDLRIILYPVFLYPKVDSMPNRTLPPADLTTSRILQTWWPLALGWLIMNVEMPVLSAFVARMFDPKHNLAAWGIVVSLAMILASPVMMMLSASTALSKDWASYCRVRRYMFVIAGGLTLLHGLMVFTPVSYTHLDVYKRQAVTSSFDAQLTRSADERTLTSPQSWHRYGKKLLVVPLFTRYNKPEPISN